MMEHVEMKNTYFALIVDKRVEMRQEAERKLMASGDENEAMLASIGKMVAHVIVEAGPPHELSKALKAFGNFPVGGVWNEFMETTGREVLAKAARMAPGADRTEMASYGMKIAGFAQSGGFPLSESTMGMIRELKEAEKSLGQLAQSIMMHNQLLSPKGPMWKTQPTPKPSVKKRQETKP